MKIPSPQQALKEPPSSMTSQMQQQQDFEWVWGSYGGGGSLSMPVASGCEIERTRERESVKCSGTKEWAEVERTTRRASGGGAWKGRGIFVCVTHTQSNTHSNIAAIIIVVVSQWINLRGLELTRFSINPSKSNSQLTQVSQFYFVGHSICPSCDMPKK